MSFFYVYFWDCHSDYLLTVHTFSMRSDDNSKSVNVRQDGSPSLFHQ